MLTVKKIETGKRAKDEGVFLALYNRDQKITLMQMRSDGKIGFPGGTVDPGEDLLQALHREMLEETGYDMGLDILMRHQFLCTHSFERKDGTPFHTHLFLIGVDIDTMKEVMISTTEAEHFIEENNGNFVVSLKEENGINNFLRNFMANTVQDELIELFHFIKD